MIPRPYDTPRKRHPLQPVSSEPTPDRAPSPEPVTLRDIDIQLINGHVAQFTLEADDVFEDALDLPYITIRYAKGESVKVLRTNVCIVSERQRVINPKPALFEPSGK